MKVKKENNKKQVRRPAFFISIIMAKNKKFKFQILGVILVLVVLPLISWYYLSQGLDYRQKTLAELEDLGELESYGFEGFSVDDHKEKMIITAFFDDRDLEKVTGYLEKLHEQFNEREDVVFVNHMQGHQRKLRTHFEEKGLIDPEQIFLKAGSNVTTRGVFQSVYGGEDRAFPCFIFIDTNHVIRRFYDLEDKQVRRLIEHIALTLPVLKERDLIFKRETEK